jgi:hypothetical protein
MSVVKPDGDSLDSKAIDFSKLEAALKPFRGKDHGLFLHVFFRPPASKDAAQVLCWALEGFGRDAGFTTVLVVRNFRDEDWKQMTAAADQGRADAEEPATGNDLVKVYPVRTALSRQLTFNADCVVDIVPPLEGQGDGLKPGVREAIRVAVGQLKLPRKDRVQFRVHRGSEEAHGRFETTATDLAKSLGFNRHSSTHD